MMRTGMRRSELFESLLRISLANGLLLAMAWGCSSTEEKLLAAKLAQGCTINSDCVDPLVCAFERCHVACEEDCDCASSLRCVRGPRSDLNVCQLPDEVTCRNDKDCPGLQLCGVDGECRDGCEDDIECTQGQICAASDECASTVASKDKVDSEGNIVPRGTGGSAGAGGSPGTGEGGQGGEAGGTAGTAGTDASGGSGALGGMGGANDAGSAGNGGTGAAGGDTNTSGAGGASAGSGGSAGVGGSGGGGPVEDYVETSDGVETVENNDCEHTVPLTATASIFLTKGDEDWFSVQAPDDGRAHVIEIGIQQQAGLSTELHALAGADYAKIGFGVFAAGVTSVAYVSVGPGTTTLLQFFPYASTEQPSGKRAELSFQLLTEDDPHEPNNTRQTATAIPLGVPVTAQFMVPFTSAASQIASDWYEVELEAGTATVSLVSTPTDGQFRIHRVNPQNVSSILASLAEGQIGDFSFSVPEAGTYAIHFERYVGFLPFALGAKPGNVSETYTFQVTQSVQ